MISNSRSKKFINRERELESLNSLYGDGRFDLAILYGQRRVGKTRLIKEFLKGKKGVYFLADKSDVSRQVTDLLRLIAEELDRSELIEFFKVETWLEFFRLLKREITQEFILIIDEYTYLTMTDKATSSIFQKAIDEILQDTPITLILSGSLITLMYEETIAYRAPLYGRNSRIIKLKPLRFRKFQMFYPRADFKKSLEFFSVLGGLPHYCEQFDEQPDIMENIKTVLFNPDHKMFNEVEDINRESFREPIKYFNILRVIASGETTHSKIANAVNLPANQLDSYLDKLINLQLLDKMFPVTDNTSKSKNGLYVITNNFYSFWFKYVFPNKSSLSIGRTDGTMKKLKSEFPAYLGRIYENVAKELLWEYEDKLFMFERIGSWWGKSSVGRVTTAEEIDIVAVNQDTNQILFGECKWTESKVDIDLYEDLIRKSKWVKWRDSETRQSFYILFSKSGFTKKLLDLAKTVPNLVLVEEDRLVNLQVSSNNSQKSL